MHNISHIDTTIIMVLYSNLQHRCTLEFKLLLLLALSLIFSSCKDTVGKPEENPFAVKLINEERWGERFQTQLRKSDSSVSKIYIISDLVNTQFYVASESPKDTIPLKWSYGISLEDIRVVDSSFLEIKYPVRLGSNSCGSEYALITFGRDGDLVTSLAIFYEYCFYLDNYYHLGAPEVDDEFRYDIEVDFRGNAILLEENLFKRSFDDTLTEKYINGLKYDSERSIFYNIIDSNGIYGVELSNPETQDSKQKYIDGLWKVIYDY